MWNRSELKLKAKAVLKSCYWKAVLMSVVATIALGGMGGGGGHSDESMQSVRESFLAVPGYIWGIVLGIVGSVFIVGLLVKIFLLNPLYVGTQKFFLDSVSSEDGEPAELNVLGYAFANAYKSQVITMFLSQLFISLWTLLLIIPGIIKAYEYRMVPYILSEEPELDYREVLEKSRKMMYGEKMNAFVLDLSFIGWHLLSAVTCGLAFLFYTGPYIQLTNAELYMALKNKNGVYVEI